MHIGFIGSGNMAQAILKGLVDHASTSLELSVTSRHYEHSQDVAQRFNATAFITNQELAAAADVIVLAVKPAVVPDVLKEIGPLLANQKKVLISIAAGLSLEKLQQLTHNPQISPIIRVMPNLAAAVGQGASAICSNSAVTTQQLETATMIFDSVGQTYPLSEIDFDTFSAIGGSSPAFAFLFIDALARAGVKHGLPKKQATEIAAQSLLGSAALLLKTGTHPWELIDQVCSPGGTTVEGILSLEKDAFSGIIAKSIDATITKNQQLEKNIGE